MRSEVVVDQTASSADSARLEVAIASHPVLALHEKRVERKTPAVRLSEKRPRAVVGWLEDARGQSMRKAKPGLPAQNNMWWHHGVQRNVANRVRPATLRVPHRLWPWHRPIAFARKRYNHPGFAVIPLWQLALVAARAEVRVWWKGASVGH